MLIAFLIFVSLVAGLFLVLGIAIGRTGRDVLRGEIQSLRETLAGTLGELKQSEDKAEKMTEIARSALEVAKKHTGLLISPAQHDQLESQFDFQSVAPNYVPPQAKNCPQCFVSVRSDKWPQECPACHCLFGFSEE